MRSIPRGQTTLYAIHGMDASKRTVMELLGNQYGGRSTITLGENPHPPTSRGLTTIRFSFSSQHSNQRQPRQARLGDW